MKTYLVTVNGKAYEVEVEEINGGSINNYAKQETVVQTPIKSETPAPVVTKEITAPVAKPVLKTSGAGNPVNSPLPGKVTQILVKVNDVVKANQPILMIEAMKMENEIVAPSDGVILSIDVNAGDTISANAVLMTIG